MYVVDNDWLSVTWCFGEPDISGDDRIEDLCAEETAEVGCNLFRERGAVVEHCEQNSFNGQGRVDSTPKAHERIVKLGDPFHGVILALNRDEDRIAGSQRVDGQQIESWRTIDQYEVVVGANALCEGLEPVLAVFHADQLDCSSD